MIGAGADVNGTDTNGHTALWLCASSGHRKCVELLITAGADVNLTLETKSSSTPLNAAAWNGMTSCAELLIQAGADVNKAAINWDTPLINAATNGHHKMIELLLNAGADISAATNIGDTALINAGFDGYVTCVNLLINAGADVNLPNDQGETALHQAAYMEQHACVSALIHAGGNVNVATKQVTTPLMEAARRNSGTKCMKLLLEAGATINKVNCFGNNALQMNLTSKRGNRNAAMYLLAAGEKLPAHVPESMQQTVSMYTLKATCREAIRNRLLELNPQLHLFNRVAQLGLPPALVSYLLYNVPF